MPTVHIPLLRYRRLLYQYLAPHKGKAVCLGAALLISIGLQLLSPQILRRFVDIALDGTGTEPLLRLAMLFLAVGVLNQLFGAVATYLGADVGWSSTNALREDLARHCLRLDMTFHNARTPGEMIERIDGDVTSLSNFFSQFVIRIAGSALLAIGVLVLLYRESIMLGVSLTVFSAAALAALLRCRQIAVPASVAQRESSSRFFGFMEEMLAGLDDIRANAGGRYVMDRFYRTNHAFFHASRRAWMLRASLFYLLLGLFAVADVMAIGMGVHLQAQGLITVGTVFMFFHYTEMLRHPLAQITMQLQDLQNAGAAIERIDELLRIRTALREAPSATLPGKGPLGVAFRDVSFGYSPGAPVLRQITLDIPPGRVLGLLGRTGSGKTTLTRLLFRLYDISEGVLQVGGTDIRSLALAEVRARIGVVTQDVQLFHATVRDNLTFFDDRISDGYLLEVIEELGLTGWLQRLPHGLDSVLQSGAQGLSAGEAQLLACIRIFLKDPGLVILDEPSSRLDPVTERLVQAAWNRLLTDRTGIVIAHRLSTIAHVDDILILEDGRIREHGPRERLAADPRSRFSELLRTAAGREVLR
jgi:ATP-binding cassette, subfamily B, bacterial